MSGHVFCTCDECQSGVVSRPDFDICAFLAESGRPASVATVTPRGTPALATMWFLHRVGRMWFHTPSPGTRRSPFLQAAEESRAVSVMVATFDPPQDVRQVRVTGPAQIAIRDDALVRAIYARYLEAWTPEWEEQATSHLHQLWSVPVVAGMAVSFPNLEGGTPFRWTSTPEFLA